MVNVMTILSPGGYVGINNAAPTEKLDVTGNIRFSGALKPNNLSGTAGQFLTSQGAGTPTWTTPANATASVTGFLSNTDWTTFNNKFSLPTLTSGSILFSNGTTIAQNNAKLFWDATNNRLGIGNSAPANTLHINASTYDYLRYGLEDGMNTLKIGFNTTGWVFRTAQNSGNTSDLNIMYDNGTTKTGRITLNQIGGVGITGDLTASGDVTAVDGAFTTLKVGTSGFTASATNVGILNSAPSSKFHIGTDAQHALKYDFDAGSSVLQLTRGTTYAFKFATTQNSGVMDRMVMSYVNGASTTELVTYDNSGTSNIAKLATPSFKFTGGTPALGKVLTSDATGNASWSVLNAVSSVGAIAGTSNANGATITSGVLNLTPADETNGGLMTTGAQLFSGNKRFLGLLTLNDKIQLNFSGAAGGGVEFTGDGDIADNNDGYATVRFTNGLKINNAKGSLGTTTKITLGNDGNITSTGTIESAGFKLTGGTPGVGKVLVSDANGLASWTTPSTGIGGSGTAGYVSKFNASTTVLGNSNLYDDGTSLFVNSTSGSGGIKFVVNSGARSLPTAVASATTQTGAAFRIGNSSNDVMDMGAGVNNGWIQVTDKLNLASSYALQLNPNGGNVGIGLTTAPTSKLQVNGDVAATTFNGLIAKSNGTNVVLGQGNVLVSLTTGANNVAVGQYTLNYLDAGSENLGMGYSAMYNTRGSKNIGLGHNALWTNNGGNNNTAIGHTAGYANTGSNNTFLGYQSNSTGSITNATAIGNGATVTADNTIQLGNTSVTEVKTSGAINAPIYTSTPVALTAGATITWTPLSGLNASVTLNANSTLAFGATPPAGTSGTLIITQPASGGPYSLTLPTVSGKTNKVLGSASGILLSSTASAKDILSFYYDGSDFYWNVGLGYGTTQNISANAVSGGVAGAMLYQTAANTTGFTTAGTAGQILTSTGTTAPSWTSTLPIANGGTGSGTKNFIDLSTAQTIDGVKTFTTSIVSNTIPIGKGAGQGNENTAVGVNALGTGTGERNTAVGANAMSNFIGTSFKNNTSMGYNNLSGLTTGYGNTSMGAEAMATIGTGGDNTAIGNQTLRIATSSNNTVLGASAGNTITTGSGNTMIGRGADVASGGGAFSNATAIGYGALATADNMMQLGNTGLINVKTSGTITAGAITYPNVAGTNGYVLTTNGTSTATWSAPTGAISGGTTNAIPKYTSATALGASSISDDGTTVSINNPVTFNNKTVAGGSAAVNSASIAAGTTAYTLQQSDNGKVINCANTGSLTITIPSGLTAGFNCMIVQMAAGSVTISAGASVTIYNRSNYSKTGGQYAIATIVSPSSNVFITGGDMQ
jgi:predicted small secreted protein